MIKKILISLGGFVLVVLSLGAIKIAQIKAMSSIDHSKPAASVTTITAGEESWRPSLSAIATLAPVEGVLLSADADGAVLMVGVENGSSVNAGDVLFELDATVEAAQLASAEARTDIARLNAHRATELLAKSTISQSEFDSTQAQLTQADADAGAIKALLAKKTVRAPFNGRVGIRLVNTGQYVSRGMPLISLQRLSQMYVNFTIPQRQLPLLQLGQDIAVKVDAFPSDTFAGLLVAINPEVDSTSRNLAAQALIENPDERLRAGMFVNVEVVLPAAKPAVVLPATAIVYASYGNSVYVIEKMKDADGKEYLGASQRFVKLGQTRGDQIAVTEGVKVGDEVATAGVFKLRNSLPVQINNTVQPSNNPAPKPANT